MEEEIKEVKEENKHVIKLRLFGIKACPFVLAGSLIVGTGVGTYAYKKSNNKCDTTKNIYAYNTEYNSDKDDLEDEFIIDSDVDKSLRDETIISVYSKWQKGNHGKYERSIVIYTTDGINISENELKDLLRKLNSSKQDEYDEAIEVLESNKFTREIKVEKKNKLDENEDNKDYIEATRYVTDFVEDAVEYRKETVVMDIAKNSIITTLLLLGGFLSYENIKKNKEIKTLKRERN